MKFRGEVVEFIRPFETRYKCASCENPLTDAVQTACGHRFCDLCAVELLKRTMPCCPQDGEPLLSSQIFNDMCARREVLQLSIYCPQKSEGCDAILSLQDLEVHQEECLYRLCDCPQCKMKLMRLALHQHLAEACRHKLVKCSSCDGSVPFFTLALLQHVLECHMRPMKCKYSAFGCDYVDVVSQVGDHEKCKVPEHLLQITEHFAKADLNSAELKTDLEELLNEREMLLSVIKKQDAEISHLQGTICLLNKSISDLQEAVAGNTKRLADSNKQIHISVNSRLQKIESWQKENLVELEKIKSLKQVSEVGDTGEQNLGRSRITLTTTSIAAGINDLRTEVMSKLEGFDFSYNGSLIWKISNYRSCKQDAVAGRSPSLISPPFYTSRYGYKVGGRAYLHGDGEAKDTYVSLYFVIMSGEYDFLLPWPFKQKVTLTLLDQSGTGHHLVDQFLPDVKSSSFQRPTRETNRASGCPFFVQQKILESSNLYLKNDTIYIKLEVDKTGLNDL
ncbi:PREDICTED: TNF receptor-associated factor 3-like isoform X2 [Priapulus caudatus]|uniref:TNF receptor-associated factor 3-like isoform X2 n=1 Tax=Priapulus caudatus TaxID=37621 RepID=A0ABM1DSQ8_PRICU|nr:PREDICTED: TNF receptor-associated factor 3-like isoform X2 [Priapulus caudatus]